MRVKDLFGIDEICPTKEGGREWYIDMEYPFSDDLFSSTFDRNITKQQDGSCGDSEERDFTSDLDWRARGGRHNNEHPCDGTAYIGTRIING